MKKQMIICVGREYGSGGHVIARDIAKKYDLPYYDRKLLDHIAEEKGVNLDKFQKYDEKSKNSLTNRRVRGFSTSSEDNLAKMQFDFLRDKAAQGESFVLVGRCGNSILKDYDGMISIFVTGDMEKKIQRTATTANMSLLEAERLCMQKDKKRRNYHNTYCKEKWGDSRHYEMIINTSRLGIDACTDIVAAYIDRWLEEEE